MFTICRKHDIGSICRCSVNNRRSQESPDERRGRRITKGREAWNSTRPGFIKVVVRAGGGNKETPVPFFSFLPSSLIRRRAHNASGTAFAGLLSFLFSALYCRDLD